DAGATDRAALAPWRAIGREATERAARLLHPARDAVLASGALPGSLLGR
ncbi:helix-turn-helix domain-containing protein, partial [Angustibacter aerolatus]